MALGTIMSIDEENNLETLAKVFAQLPYTVIWKHSGPEPKHLGTNTKLVKPVAPTERSPGSSKC